MKKRTVFTEAGFFLGILILAFGTALMERADFGMSMVVAPAYLIHLKVSQDLPFYSFGMSEYVLQAVLLVLMCLILRRFRLSYLLSFVTAVLFGLALDLMILLVGLLPFSGLVWRVGCYLLGMLFCSVGISLFFHSYLPPEVYELFVREFSAGFGTELHRTKTVYDCCSCLVAVVLSFCFFGFWHFEGVKLGTVICALVNGTLIRLCSRLLDRCFRFRDALPWREKFLMAGEKS